MLAMVEEIIEGRRSGMEINSLASQKKRSDSQWSVTNAFRLMDINWHWRHNIRYAPTLIKNQLMGNLKALSRWMAME